MKKIIPLIIITLLTMASCHRSKDIPEERRLFQFLGKSVVLNNAICDLVHLRRVNSEEGGTFLVFY